MQRRRRERGRGRGRGARMCVCVSVSVCVWSSISRCKSKCKSRSRSRLRSRSEASFSLYIGWDVVGFLFWVLSHTKNPHLTSTPIRDCHLSPRSSLSRRFFSVRAPPAQSPCSYFTLHCEWRIEEKEIKGETQALSCGIASHCTSLLRIASCLD